MNLIFQPNQGNPNKQVIVQKTFDYKLFKLLDQNRDVNPLHVRALERSMTIKAIDQPIIVNQHFEIIDGQHRFQARMNLGLHIPFIVIPGATIEDVKILNATNRTWSKMDYLEAYIKEGKEPYIVLKKFMDDYNFSLPTAEALLTMNSSGTNNKSYLRDKSTNSHTPIKGFQEGKLEIVDFPLATKVAKALVVMRKSFEQAKDTRFARALQICCQIQGFELSRFLHKFNLRIEANDVKHQASILDYINEFERIYNFKSKESERLNLYFYGNIIIQKRYHG